MHKLIGSIAMASDLIEILDSLYFIDPYEDATEDATGVLSKGQTEQLKICGEWMTFFKMMQCRSSFACPRCFVGNIFKILHFK